MAYIYYNPNPCRKSTSDCVIRAIAKILDLDWGDVYLGLCEEGFAQCDLPNSNVVFNKYLLDRGFRKYPIPNTCPQCYSLAEFCLDHPIGEFIVCTGDHVVAVIDGNHYDLWNSEDVVPAYFYERGMF